MTERRAVAEAWLHKATSDVRTMEILLAEQHPPYDSVCFHAQQAAEKALKALLTFLGISFPRTHDLALLVRLVPRDHVLDVDSGAWAELSYFAVGPRYPDDLIEYTRRLAEDLQAKSTAIYSQVRDTVLA